MGEAATPLTDKLLDTIANRLKARGARSEAARQIGISRQNLGRMLRERGVPRESEVLLKLDEVSRRLAAKAQKTATGTPDDSPDNQPVEELPAWML